MKVKQLEMGYVGSNTYIISHDDHCILIDPCADPMNDLTKILEAIGDSNVSSILLTHAHFDHISGVDGIVEIFQCPVYIHKNEVSWLKDPSANLSRMIPEKIICTSKVIGIEENMILNIQGLKIETILCSGHTKHSLAYKIHNFIFDGDFIFKDSVGRVDLPTGSMDDMRDSINTFVKKYRSEDIVLYPGHGPSTSLKREIELNPYVRHSLSS